MGEKSNVTPLKFSLNVNAFIDNKDKILKS